MPRLFETQIERMKGKIKHPTKPNSVSLGQEMHDDMVCIITDMTQDGRKDHLQGLSKVFSGNSNWRLLV